MAHGPREVSLRLLHTESKSEPSGTGGTGYAHVEDRMNLQF